jgi:hypothetical protein
MVMRKMKKRNPGPIPTCITIIKDDHQRYHCNSCRSKGFKTKAQTYYHEFCGTGEKRFKCDFEQCTLGFMTKSHYDYHMRSHTGGEWENGVKNGVLRPKYKVLARLLLNILIVFQNGLTSVTCVQTQEDSSRWEN